MNNMTTKELRNEIIKRLRDAGYDNYISMVELYTHKVYEDAQKDAEEGHWGKITQKVER